MARQRAGIPEVEGFGQQADQTQSGSTMSSAPDAPGSASGAATGSATGGGSGLRSDQERQREIAREGTATSSGGAGSSTQRGGLGRTGIGNTIAGRGQSPSLIPMLMNNPALMASAFMSNPFGFAQAMTQAMDRVFSAFNDGFGSPIGQVGGGMGRAAAGGAQQGMQQAQQGMQQGVQRGAQQQSAQSPSGQQQGFQRSGGQLTQWIPAMEVLQRGDQLVVRADLPGLTPDDVEIEIEDGVLTVSGERRHSFEDRQEGLYRTERSYGAFSRSIALPEGIDEDQVQARFEHGVLEVTVPLPQQSVSRARRVQVQSGSGAGQSSAQQPGQSAGAAPAQGAGQSSGQSEAQSQAQSSTQNAADIAGQSPS
jgi:HSP20 family protein